MWLDNDIQSPCPNKTTDLVNGLVMIFGFRILCEAYYALGKDRFIVFMTSAIHIVADLETPTRQCTNVAVPSNLPASNT